MMEYNNVQCLSANKLRDVHWEGSGGWVCERECAEVRDTMSAYACICTHLKHGTTGRDADLNLSPIGLGWDVSRDRDIEVSGFWWWKWKAKKCFCATRASHVRFRAALDLSSSPILHHNPSLGSLEFPSEVYNSARKLLQIPEICHECISA